MRLICPHCMNAVAVPDDAAGKEATCPSCGRAFPTPPRYNAAVSEAASAAASGAAPPPGLVPPPAPPTPAPAPHIPAPPGYVPPESAPGFLPSSADAPAPAGYTKTCGITISPKVVAWLPAAFLTATFLLTFFPWVSTNAGSHPVHWQRMWGSMFGLSPNRDFSVERATAMPSEWINKLRSDWELLLPFAMALIVALVVAWAERLFGPNAPHKLPPLTKIWPWRNVVIAGLAGLMLSLLLIQILNGFGMERAIRKQITEKFADERAKVANDKAELAALEYKEEQEFARYHLEHTTWMYLALGCTALAVLSVMTRVALDNRGNRPPPKLVLHY